MKDIQDGFSSSIEVRFFLSRPADSKKHEFLPVLEVWDPSGYPGELQFTGARISDC